MDEKRVQIGVDIDQGSIQQARALNERLLKDMVDSAREFKEQSRATLADMQEQIRLTEERGRVAVQSRRREIEEAEREHKLWQLNQQERMTAMEGTDKREFATAYRQEDVRRKGILTEERGELQELINNSKEQVQELKFLREEQKNSDRRQIQSDRQAITEQKKVVQELQEQDPESPRRTGKQQAIRSQLPYLGAVAGAGNIYEAGTNLGAVTGGGVARMGGAAGLLGSLGVLGALAAGRAVQASMPYGQNLGRFAGLTGGSLSQYEGFGRGFQDFGFTMDQTLAARFEASRARGTTAGSGRAALDALLLQRGYSLDAGMTGQLDLLSRADVGGLGAMGTTTRALGQLRGTGALSGTDTAILPEYLQILIQLGNEQVKRLGSIDTGTNIKMVSAIAGLDETFKNPQVLGNLVGSLQQGLMRGANPQTEALQFSVLSGISPQASLLDLMEMREAPFSERSREYLPSYLGQLQQISGGGDQFALSIMQQFGLSATVSRRLAEGFSEGRLQDVLGEEFGTMDPSRGQIAGRATNATDALSRSMAVWTNTFQQTGKDIVDAFDKLLGEFGEFKSKLSELTEANRENVKQQQELGETLMESNRVIDKMTGALIYTGATNPVSIWR